MISDIAAKLRRSLVRHEGLKRFPYLDSTGKITIGIGYNLTDRGLPDEWINAQYEKDVEYFHSQLDHDFKWFSQLNGDRQTVLVDMCFMGYKRFLEFEKMLAYLAQGNFDEAAREMLSSEWAQQTKSRAIELSEGLRTGEYNV